MHVSLTPDLESRVKANIEVWPHGNATEAVREALLMHTHKQSIHEIKLAEQ
ncbi:MAG TPA: hypothetical protein VIC30_13425 [Orrella sp.]